MNADSHRCSFCGGTYSGSTEIAFDTGSGSAICSGCLATAAEMFEFAEADQELGPNEVCLHCEAAIEDASVACIVKISGPRISSSWRAHVACIEASLSPAFRTPGPHPG
jgi:hypothetical protein